MKRLLLIILITFFGLLSRSYGDEIDESAVRKNMLVINPLVSNLQLTDVEKRMINKITIKVCAKQNKYQIALGEIGIAKNASFAITNLELSLTESPQGIQVSAILLDEIKKQVIGKEVVERVQRLNLMRNIENSLDLLFNHRSK